MRQKKNTEKAYKNAGNSGKSGKKSLNKDGKGNRSVSTRSKYPKSEKSDTGTSKTKSDFNRKSGPSKDRPNPRLSDDSRKTPFDSKRPVRKRPDSGNGKPVESRERPFDRKDKPKRGGRETEQKSFSGSKRGKEGKDFKTEKTGSKTFSDKPKSYGQRQSTSTGFLKSEKSDKFSDKKSFDKKPFGKKSFDKPFDKKPSFGKKDFADKKGTSDKKFSSDKRELGDKKTDKKAFDKPFDKKPAIDKKGPSDKKFSDKKSSFDKKDSSDKKKSFDKKPFGKRDFAPSNKKFNATKTELEERKLLADKGEKINENDISESDLNYIPSGKKTFSSKGDSHKNNIKGKRNKPSGDGTLRLNKFIANSGVCSRREADQLIMEGLISVNDTVVTELGYKVLSTDKVKYEGKLLKRENLVYILLNKPKDFITTVDDPQERKTVMQLIAGACEERVYPVGRLDRNTTGLLVLTNDGELADLLTHPSSQIGKIYEVELDKALEKEDFDTIQAGKVYLFDGQVKVDEMAFLAKGKKHIGLEIHEGRNRIVRRLFEHLGYDVVRLDRTTYAGLTKRDLPRGSWRMLTKTEVMQLKQLGR